jgi:hypothetical protein
LLDVKNYADRKEEEMKMMRDQGNRGVVQEEVKGEGV